MTSSPNEILNLEIVWEKKTCKTQKEMEKSEERRVVRDVEECERMG